MPSRPGLLASSHGRILLPTRLMRGFHQSVWLTKPRPTAGVLKSSRAGGSYRYMALSTQLYGNLKVHQCVCEAWHGPRPFPEALVLHEDEDSTNNRPWNLRWGTHAENMQYPGYRAARSVLMQGNRLGARA